MRRGRAGSEPTAQTVRTVEQLLPVADLTDLILTMAKAAAMLAHALADSRLEGRSGSESGRANAQRQLAAAAIAVVFGREPERFRGPEP